MDTQFSNFALFGLVLASAIGYAAATAGIKMASHSTSSAALALVLAGFALWRP